MRTALAERTDTGTSTSRQARNLKEKQRRLRLKYLFSKLASFLPSQPSRASALDCVDHAISYINQFQERLKTLSKRLEQLNGKRDDPPEITIMVIGDEEVEVNFREKEEHRGIFLQQLLHTMKDQGAQVKNLTYATAGGYVFGTIRAEAIHARIGIDISNIAHGLKKLAY